jgi:hypothetical protein
VCSAYDRQVDLRRLRLSLVAAQLVGFATLLRSIAYDRWITVLAALLLIGGAAAAQRGRSWGVALALGAAAAFPVAWAIGIAPVWFCLVGLIGALPFAIASRAFARFDKGATALLALLAGTAGAAGAIAWKVWAWDIFMMFPISRPSAEAQHGLALAALCVSAAIATRLGRGPVALASQGLTESEEQRVRVGERFRVSDASETSRASSEGADIAETHEDIDAYGSGPKRARIP